MQDHQIATRAEWLTARADLLKREKEHTQRGDEIAQMRQALPWVRIDKEYRFETDSGSASLSDLFQGRSQLMVYHFMFGPDYAAGCPSCSGIADCFNGFYVHLANHDVMLWAISRGPLANLQAYKKRMGWTFPWASSSGCDFNSDFGVGFSTEEQLQGVEYNYRHEAAYKLPQAGTVDRNVWGTGVDRATFLRERPGLSTFVLHESIVYHSYSTYARGVDALWGMWQWLDRAPKGRNETGHWWRRHDEYDNR